MEFQEYMQAEVMFSKKPFELPEEFFPDGELDISAGMEHLVELGLIYNNSTDLPTYGEELREYSPGTYRFLESFFQAQRQAMLDRLVENEILEFYWDDGKEKYRFSRDLDPFSL